MFPTVAPDLVQRAQFHNRSSPVTQAAGSAVFNDPRHSAHWATSAHFGAALADDPKTFLGIR